MKKILVLLLLCTLFCTPASAKYEGYVETARADGVVTGDENGDFNEDKIASRAEFAVMLVKFLNLDGGINVFSDVKSSDWFSHAMAAASRYGLLVGDENNMARPGEAIKREDAVTVLGRYYKAVSKTGTSSGAVSDYAAGYWGYAEDNGLIGEEQLQNPAAAATKGELLKMIYDYDSHVSSGVRFLSGYPKLSERGVFNRIRIDVKTNKPCIVYYRICEANAAVSGPEIELCRTEARTVMSASVAANINKTYNVYLRAVEEGGAWKSAVIEGVQPFSVAIGDGTEASPYIAYTQQQLAQLSHVKNAAYRLGADINITGEWKPIEGFSGILDGNGYKVNMEGSDGSSNGLFGTLEGAAVKNLTVCADVRVSKNGGIIASVNDGGIIEGCTALGMVEVKTDGAGGICGQNRGTVKNCLSAAYSVASGSFAGGICGQNFSVVENCLSAVEVVASEMYAGGISGTNDGGSIESSVSACMTIYDTLTTNSGKLTTNKKGGIVRNSYCYEDVISNAAYEEPGEYSQNGFDASWEELCGEDFYKELGWDMQLWNTKKSSYRLIYPKKTQEPQMLAGKTAYFPKSITNERELRELDADSAGHYILSNDIFLTLPWKTVCMNGFSGTFDGNGHAVYNLNLKGEAGMFSNITGGTVRNLTLRDVTAAPTAAGAILTACNYGYIENCVIYGRIEAKKTGYMGTVAGENHGAVENCEVYVDIVCNNANATVGGICAENDGMLQGSLYTGKITLNSENVVVGGICGYDTGGNIFECFANATAFTESASGYIGGICGIASGTQMYKCSTAGNIVSKTEDTAYIGGICAVAESAVIYNNFSLTDIHGTAGTGYAGGICGCNSGSNVQNTYSAGNITASAEMSAGGICGFAENAFIMQNVALNPAINGGENVGTIVGAKELCAVSDNYSCEKTLVNSKHAADSEKNAVVKTLTSLKNSDFFFRPISEGGFLGWETDVWSRNASGYLFPTLLGVKGQDTLRMPSYK